MNCSAIHKLAHRKCEYSRKLFGRLRVLEARSRRRRYRTTAAMLMAVGCRTMKYADCSLARLRYAGQVSLWRAGHDFASTAMENMNMIGGTAAINSMKIIEMIPSKSGVTMNRYPAGAIAQAWLYEYSRPLTWNDLDTWLRECPHP